MRGVNADSGTLTIWRNNNKKTHKKGKKKIVRGNSILKKLNAIRKPVLRRSI